MTLHTSITGGFAPLRPEDAALLCRIARDRGGLALSPEKRQLLEQRLSRRMRVTGHASYTHYIADLVRPGNDAELQAVIEALTTHTTGFFREPSQFDWLRKTGLPARIADGAGTERPLVLWSAACSTGAELWTAAMVTDRIARASFRPLRWRVIGSDLSARILKRASRAIYTEDEITGLPEDYRSDYLLRSRRRQGSGHIYRIVPDLRRTARLYRANLVEAAPVLDAGVDAALLRNVLIYFDAPGRAAAVRNVMSRLLPGGYLLTGHTESLNPVPQGLSQIAPSIYRKD
jgi:chemotaxis protein methyltransferase CheR